MSLFAPKPINLKPFVPAKDFKRSLEFYQDIGFELKSNEDGIAFLELEGVSFLLQEFYHQELAENLMLHLQLEGGIQEYWQQLTAKGITSTYGVKMTEPTKQPWRMIDFCLYDPSGVLWRIAVNC